MEEGEVMKGNLKPYMVEWEDCASFGRWMDLDVARKMEASQCVTVGFLVEKTPQKLVMTLNRDTGGGDVSDTIVIPRSLVKSCRRLYPK